MFMRGGDQFGGKRAKSTGESNDGVDIGHRGSAGMGKEQQHGSIKRSHRVMAIALLAQHLLTRALYRAASRVSRGCVFAQRSAVAAGISRRRKNNAWANEYPQHISKIGCCDTRLRGWRITKQRMFRRARHRSRSFSLLDMASTAGGCGAAGHGGDVTLG